MGHSSISCLMHCVFSTKERRPQIVPELQDRLWAYLGGIARDNGLTAISIGGTCDHCHALLSLPGKMDVSKALTTRGICGTES